MTDKENEENPNSSNSKLPDIKNKNVQQQEQDINLQIRTSTSQEQKIEIVSTNEELVIRSPNRPRITESDEAESSKKNEQESVSYLNCDELGEDPLLTTEKILLKYNDFIEYVYQILEKDEKKQDWSEIVERVQMLDKTLNEHLSYVEISMEVLEEMGGFEKQYDFRKIHIVDILDVIQSINKGIASSGSFRLVSDIKNRGKVLPICLGEFEGWREDLIQLIESMQTVKKRAMEVDRDNDTKRPMEEDDEETD
ncbi:hypothetical protein Csa_020750 [Cucumis sativus]|uniref:Uncharacterized protein n=1 Tax=Cucumis sativus TaxID=3659 RepID=A0A0A0KC44_CUCSA|nr:hypothetical protein Csa_020750 [Cucumis sativus]